MFIMTVQSRLMSALVKYEYGFGFWKENLELKMKVTLNEMNV